MDSQTIDRFWAKVEKTDCCWFWRASIRVSGYGQFAVRHDQIILAHRFAYSITKGEIPAGLSVCHTCDVRHCVNPDHLWLGTIADNSADMVRKGRHRNGGKNDPHPGETHPNAKLTTEQIQTIRSLHAAGVQNQRQLGRMFSVTAAHIIKFVNRKARVKG